MTEKDKRIRIWLAAKKPTLAEGLEKSIPMLKFFENSPGSSPMAVLNTCYKQLGLILLREVGKYRFGGHYHFLNIF